MVGEIDKDWGDKLGVPAVFMKNFGKPIDPTIECKIGLNHPYAKDKLSIESFSEKTIDEDVAALDEEIEYTLLPW
jgi:hypothetical protein